MNKCSCGEEPKLRVELYNPYPKTYFVQCECGETTSGCFTDLDAIAEWNRMEHGTKLKPCPFCGEPARIWERIDGVYYAQCDCCNAKSDDTYSKKSSEELWNRRTK